MLNLVVAPNKYNSRAEKYVKKIVKYLKAEKVEYSVYFSESIDEVIANAKELLSFGENEFAVFGIPNMNADENTKNTVMEYITKINLGMRNGNFLLNPENGEVRYRTYVNARGIDTIPNDVIGETILVPAMMIDRYGNGLAALMMGYSDPDTEIANAHKIKAN